VSVVPATLSRPVVFVVDDDVSVREALELMLAEAGYLPELFAAAQDFLARPPAIVPCCLILDVEMPGLGGLDLQERLSRERSEMPILFLTGHGDIPKSVRAMKAGAAEFFTKPFDSTVLLQAIERAIERSRAALEEAAQSRALRVRHASLTPREREVMALVVSGLLNKQVGGQLDISEITVKAHRGRVMEKMQADSLADLVRMAERLKALDTFA
jgi:FixJ family two-component response regulator